MACTERMAVTSGVISGTTDLSMICPPARGADEAGGQFSVFTGPAFPDDASTKVTCTVR